jgi:hypothetical protein
MLLKIIVSACQLKHTMPPFLYKVMLNGLTWHGVKMNKILEINPALNPSG